MGAIHIGTAGWTIPREVAHAFPADGTSLERYAARFSIVEINSSFHRSHRISTWERWRDSVPDGFRFAVKAPKIVTHQRKLVDCAEVLDDFVAEANTLADKLGVVLVQLPPKLEFDARHAADFFAALQARCPAPVACEPRHPSWFEDEAGALLSEHRIARVAADPAICEAAAHPGGWRGLSYWRLHGSPAMYRSSYLNRIADYATILKEGAKARDTWCIFDNTASSAATSDALALIAAVS